MSVEQDLNKSNSLIDAIAKQPNNNNKLFNLHGNKLKNEIPVGFTGFNNVFNNNAIPIPTLHKLYIPHSMYHMSQLLLVLLQDFFSEGLPKDYNWRWTNDFNTTNILFDTVFNKEGVGIGKKPLVVVSHADISGQQVSIGNLQSGHINFNNGSKEGMYLSLAQSMFTIQIISAAYAESELIGSLIFNYITAMQAHLPNLLGVHKVLTVSCSGTNPIRENEQLYLTSITIPVTLQMSWLSAFTPTAEELKSIKLRIEEKISEHSVEVIYREQEHKKDILVKLEVEEES